MAAASEAGSTTTIGGADFDDLCAGKVQYYSFNLLNLQQFASLRDAENGLYRHINDTTEALESGAPTRRRIGKLYIGKSFVRQKKKKRFDPMDSTTFKKEGISSRWGDHRTKDYGRDGMVVLTVITREIATQLGVKDDPRTQRNAQEICALQIEAWLQERFRDDGRFPHEAYHPGNQSKTGAVGYIIYICFSCLDSRM